MGDVYWIPDTDTGWEDLRHPWIVVGVLRQPGDALVYVIPRTTSVNGKWSAGLFTPSGIVPGLDKAGLILPATHKKIRAAQLAKYTFAGRLPELLLKSLKEYTRLRYPEHARVYGW